ncbi:unnamed protein product [Linum tenue]|uniref:SNARE associated Golgi protein family n=1 Tax=Linum tenue TaxID=586396 RepID=A0AAV0LXD4_9ROSI|nr:unnamed protein product [Linum tenue]
MMTDTSQELVKDSDHTGHHTREDGEYIRLGMSDEPNPILPHVSEPPTPSKSKSSQRWTKILTLCIVIGLVVFISIKWVLPFLFKKVLYPMMKWEATAFGRPVLALVLVGSLALFPVFLIPSGPSMWLAGMIFGYGIGFVIIIAGTTIGMILPFFIGLFFRDRIHTSSRRELVPSISSGCPFQGIPISIHNFQLCNSRHKLKILALHMRFSCWNDPGSFSLHLQVCSLSSKLQWTNFCASPALTC